MSGSASTGRSSNNDRHETDDSARQCLRRKLMRIRLLGYPLFVPVLALGVVEAFLILCALFGAWSIFRPLGSPSKLLCSSGLLFMLCCSLALLTMSLYCQRLRDRMLGVALRV